MDIQQSSHSYDSIQEYEQVLVRQYPVTPPAALSRLAREWLRERPDGRFELKLDPNLLKGRAHGSAEEQQKRSREDTELLWETLKKLPCPTLVVRGAASDILDADTADRMVDDAIPNGKLAVIGRAGHSVMLDNPGEFEKVVCEFVLG